MKNKVYILFIVIFGVLTTSYGQTDTIDCDSKIDTLTGMKIYPYLDEEPTPANGEKQLLREFQKITIPQRCMSFENRVFVAFIVDTDGKVMGKRIIKDIQGTDVGDQVLKLIDNFEWVPGNCEGVKVPAMRVLSVRVCLQ